MANIIGICKISDNYELVLFDDGTYRYEPGYTQKDFSSSFFLVEGNEVFYRHEATASWQLAAYEDGMVKGRAFCLCVLTIYEEYMFEKIFLSNKES